MKHAICATFNGLGDILRMATPRTGGTETSRTVEMVFRRLTAPVAANTSRFGEANFSVPLDGNRHLTKCPKCKENFDYANQPEVSTGAVKCPHCKAVVSQSANAKPRKIIFNRVRHDQTRDGAQAIYKKVLTKFIGAWQLYVLNALHQQRSSVTSIPNDDVEVMVRTMFDLPQFAKLFKASMFNAAQDAYEVCAKGALSEIGDNQHVTDNGITTDFALDRQNKIKDCPAGIFDDIQQSVTEGIRNGETMDELADRVKEGFKDADDDRAYLIARTESQSAYGTAQFNVLSDAGYETKRWITADDELVRTGHRLYEAQGAIPMDDDFDNGEDSISYPGDLDGEPGDTINCRCFLSTGGSAADEADDQNDEDMDNDEMFT